MTTFWSKRRTTGKHRQVKKHYKQMTLQEKKKCIELLQDSINDKKKITFSKHYHDKAKTRLDIKGLLGFIFNNSQSFLNVIEYNNTTTYWGTERRLILRSPKVVKVEGVTSFQYIVISLDRLKVISTYYNGITDTHKTLDLNYYDKSLTIK